MNIREELGLRAKHVEEVLETYLPEEGLLQKTIFEAMNYSLLAGGKRIRPILMEEAYKMFVAATGKETSAIKAFMIALEMIHTYSLVHDDLPAMDNDEYRRGRKTTHVVYGEGMAILAGDGLLNFAFETAMKAFDMEPANPAIGKALQVLAKKAGIFGMIGGQTADIEAENMDQSKVSNDLLLFIHENKTAALIQGSMMIGAILAGASEEDVKALEKIAYNVGIAFQIQDDILDITSSLEVLGKMTGSDEKNNKVTYVTLNGMEKSKEDVEKLSKEALDLLSSFENKNEFLNQLIEELITREK
jgi:geranylgeranyl diphosphate synthase type II